jgi:hypothetical protein
MNDRLAISASARVKGDWFFSTGQSPILAGMFAGSISARIFDMAFWAQPQYWTLSIIGVDSSLLFLGSSRIAWDGVEICRNFPACSLPKQAS